MEEEFRRVFGESAEEVVERERRGDVGEEAVRARARKAEIAPSDREVEEHNLDHAVFRSWCPHCVKGRAESCGHVKKAQDEGAAPTVGVDYARTHSEQAKETRLLSGSTTRSRTASKRRRKKRECRLW